MPSISVGSVTVRVVPSAERFVPDLRRQIVPGAAEIGVEIGRSISTGIREGIGDPLSGPLEESNRRQRQRAPRDGDNIAGAFAKGFKTRLETAFKALPKATIDADSSPADRKIADLRTRMEALSKKTIGVDISAGDALAELAAIKAELADVGRNATVNVRADTATAAAQLAAVQAEVDRLDGRTARVNVDTSAATGNIRALGLAMAGIAAVPFGATLGAGALGIAGALGAAGAGVGGFAAVAVPAIANVKNALVAEKAAQTASTVAAGQGQARALAMAGAQAQLASAIRNAGYAHVQALDQVRSSEQQLASAQLARTNAQQALNQAEQAATRNLEDLKNGVVDARFALEGDQLAIDAAKASYDQMAAAAQAAAVKVSSTKTALAAALAAQQKVNADPASTALAKAQAKANVDAAAAAVTAAGSAKKAADLQAAQAKLAYEQSIQRLKEQRLQLQRLEADEKATAKAGVNGSQQVVQARQQLAAADLQVTNSERALAQARAGVARADQQSADQVAAARRGVTQASLSASSATSKLGAAMAALSPTERRLATDWKALTGAYKGWAKALEPAVFPVLAGGMGLVVSQLPRLNGLVRGSSVALQGLERDAQKALGGKFWSDFITNVGKEAPVAITGLGHIGGDVLTGLAGLFQAVLPYTNSLLTGIEHLTGGFATWGKQLGTSSALGQFFTFVSKEGPVIVGDLKSVGGAILDIAKAVAPLGALQLAIIGPLADGLGAIARNAPGLIQVAVAVYAVSKATSALKLVELARGFLGVAVAEGTATAGATSLGLRMRSLGAYMMGAEAATVSTRTALLGLAKAGAAIGVVLIAAQGVGKLIDSQYGAVASTDELTKSLVKLGQTGQASGAFASQWRGGALSGKNAMQEFAQAAKEIGKPSFGDYISHGIDKAFSFIPGISNQFDKLKTRMTATDTALANMVKSGDLTGANQAFGQLAAEAAKSGVSVNTLKSLFPNYTAVLGNASVANQILTGKVLAQNQALSLNAHRFADSQTEVIDFNTSLNAASGLLAINGKAFFDNKRMTDAQRLAADQNRQSIINSSNTLQSYSDYLVTNGLVTDDSIKTLKGQRDQLITVAEKFGLSRKAAKAYVDKLVTIPKTVDTAINVHATGKYDFPGHINPWFIGPVIPGHASGGLVQGAGGPRSDSMVTRVSPKEFIVNAPATSKYLPLLAAINDEGNAGTGYRGQGYAGGGLVTLPALAGGGLVKNMPGVNYSYGYDGDAAKSLASATAGVAHGVQAMSTVAVNQTAAITAALLRLIQANGGGSKAVQFEQQQLGEPYVWGATGPNAWDCSGLVQAAWKSAGVTLPRVTYDQIKSGSPTSKAKSLPGDLYFPEPGHVMMVTGMGGNHALIHAPHTGTVVQYSPYRSGGAYRHIAGSGHAASGGSAQSASAAKTYARGQLGEFGWSGGQFSPLDHLWQRESNWRWNARNPTSGAYGIPQSLPASKMASAGSDYLTNALTQIRWGLGYIEGRYGSPSAAWAHSQNVGWYDQGGYLPPGLSTVYNGTGQPEPVLTGKQWDSVASNESHVTEYHAHFDGWTQAGVQSEVRTAFHVMEVSNKTAERVGRRR